MAVDLLQIALDFLAEYGLAAVFVLLVLDGAMLMPVLPGEAVMIMAVATYAHGPGDLVMLIIVTTAAAIVGSLLLYGIARAGGRPLVERHPRLFMMSRRRREKLERAFQKPVGQSLVLFLRVIPITRVIVNIPAGLAKMKLGRFVVLSSIGMAIFHAGFLWLAYEYRQPGSGVAIQAAALQDAYANPAWEFLQTNETLAILGALTLGALLSLKASVTTLRHPDDAAGSMLGWVSVRVLFIGSTIIAVLLGVAEVMGTGLEVLYDVGREGGLDLPAVAERLEVEPVPMLAVFAVVAWSLSAILLALEGAAKRRQKHFDGLRKQRELGRAAREEREGPSGRSESSSSLARPGNPRTGGDPDDPGW